MGLGFGVQVDNPLGTRIEQEGALRFGVKGGRSGWLVMLQRASRVLASDKILA